MTVWQGTANLNPGLTFGAMPTSLFALLQAFMETQQSDPTARRDAIESLMAYHCATISNDKYNAVVNAFHMHRQVLLLLDYMWGVFSAGPMPHSPPPAQLSETVSKVTTKRTSTSLNTLPGPKQ